MDSRLRGNDKKTEDKNRKNWIPAFAGTTKKKQKRKKQSVGSAIADQ